LLIVERKETSQVEHTEKLLDRHDSDCEYLLLPPIATADRSQGR